MAKKDSIQMLEAKIEVLTRARKKFDAGKYLGICSAIYNSYNFHEGRHLDDAADCITTYVSKELGYHAAYLDRWLEINRPKLKRDKRSMKQYRLQWIDWMLSCLEEDLKLKKAKKK